jgi:predicted cupin superfamily sugar epimerase
MLDARKVIATLGLQPHPEGGYYRETYRHIPPPGGRGMMTSIYYLLPEGERSHWHRIDGVEIWHWYAGAPLALTISENGRDTATIQLGPDILERQRPQAIVPANGWQTAESLGAWSLLGCTVAPAFEFEGFEMAPPDWMPGGVGEG